MSINLVHEGCRPRPAHRCSDYPIRISLTMTVGHPHRLHAERRKKVALDGIVSSAWWSCSYPSWQAARINWGRQYLVQVHVHESHQNERTPASILRDMIIRKGEV